MHTAKLQRCGRRCHRREGRICISTRGWSRAAQAPPAGPMISAARSPTLALTMIRSALDPARRALREAPPGSRAARRPVRLAPRCLHRQAIRFPEVFALRTLGFIVLSRSSPGLSNSPPHPGFAGRSAVVLACLDRVRGRRPRPCRGRRAQRRPTAPAGRAGVVDRLPGRAHGAFAALGGRAAGTAPGSSGRPSSPASPRSASAAGRDHGLLAARRSADRRAPPGTGWNRGARAPLTALPWFVVFRLVRKLRGQRDALEASQVVEARAAADAERGRLVREMHDVLAHSLSSLALQLESTRLLSRDRGVDGTSAERSTRRTSSRRAACRRPAR